MPVMMGDTIDPKRWDRFVLDHPSCHFMQTSTWGALRQACGWQAKHFTLQQGEEIRGGALVLSRRLPGGRSVFYMPRGPLVDYSRPGEVRELLDAVNSHVRESGGIFLRADPNFEENDEAEEILQGCGYRKLRRKWSVWNSPKFVLWLDLAKDPETMFSNLPRETRRQLRSAERKGITCHLGTMADREIFYALLQRMSNARGIGVHGPEYFRLFFQHMVQAGLAQVFLARYEGKTIAAGLSIICGKKAWLLYLASDLDYPRLNANRALQWEMICWAISRGCSSYSFRGSATNDPPSPEDPGYGVYRFKNSFGPRFVRTAGYFDYVARPLSYRTMILGEDYVAPLLVKGLVGISRVREKFTASERRDQYAFTPEPREKTTDA